MAREMVSGNRASRSQTSVVTGAAGFVGRALVRGLLAEGDSVRAIVLPGDPAAEELRRLAPNDPAFEIVEADVCDANAIAPAFRGVQRVFHTAALIHAWAPWERFRAVNVGGTRNVARAASAAGVARLLHVSTSDVFGIPAGDEILDESSPFRPWNEPYADTKIEAERWLWAYVRDGGPALTVVYPGWVYGPEDGAFFPGLARAIAAGSMVFWRREVRLPWVYVDNLVEACLRASADPSAAGEGYIVHDGDGGPTLEEVCGRIAGVIGARPPTRHVPYALAYAAARVLEATWRLCRIGSPPPLLAVDVKAFGFHWRLSTRKVREQLGWRPAIPVEEGMRRALEGLERRWKRNQRRTDGSLRQSAQSLRSEGPGDPVREGDRVREARGHR